MLGLASASHAVPHSGNIINTATNIPYSIIHKGSNGSGSGDRDDWLRFHDDTIHFDVTGNLLTTPEQTFSVYSNHGQTALFTLKSLTLDLSGPYVGGTMMYSLMTTTAGTAGDIPDIAHGTFSFAAVNHGNGFNTSTLSGLVRTTQLWGGDVGNSLGIDFKFDGVPVPEPGTLTLLGAGLAGLGLMRRRRR